MNTLAQLKRKRDMYAKLIAKHQDESGFILTHECDSTLFSGLIGTYLSVDLPAAESRPGEWYRRPLSCPECWACTQSKKKDPSILCSGSRSTISRDMLLGVLLWAVWNRRPFVIANLWDYAWSHLWRMGRGRWGGVDTFMNPALLSLIAKAMVDAGSNAFWVRLWSWLPFVGAKHRGYKRHIQALQLLLRRRLRGGLTRNELKTARRNAAEQPWNPLHLYVAGQHVEAVSELLGNPIWPDYSLPVQTVIKEPWPMQREEVDLKPGDKVVRNPGGDFIFVASLILEEYGYGS